MPSTREPSPQQGQTAAPGTVLATFAEALLEGRRVAVLGNSADDVGERAANASGRRVHVFDPDARRAGTTLATRTGGEQVTIAPLDDALEAHGGAFDAVLVPDLTLLGDARQAISRATHLLSRRGVLLVATPNPETTAPTGAISYYDLYDLVAEQLPHVSMHGQAPFAGFTIASFAVEGEPAVTIDASLMDGAEEPSWFVAVASHVPVEADPYVLVQVPHDAASGAAPESETERHAELVEAQLQRSLLTAELEKLREREQAALRRASEREASNKQLAARLAELAEQNERAQKQAAAELRDARKAADNAAQRLRGSEAEMARQADRIGELERALDAQRAEVARGGESERERERERSRLRDAQRALARERENHQAELTRTREALQAELTRTRDALQAELARTRDTLQAELARTREAGRVALERALEVQRVELEEAFQEELDTMLERIAELEEEAEAAARLAAATDAEAAAEEEGDEAPPTTPAPTLDARGYEFQLAELRRALELARRERDEQRQERERLEESARAANRLRAELDAALAERAALTSQLQEGTDGGEHAEDIERLERKLRDRGLLVEKLRAELRESERVGRELLARVLEAEDPGHRPENGEAVSLRAQLETLAQRCSRYEADLQAATWRIESLSSSLADDDTSDHDKLEQALQAAHDELAELRQRLVARTSVDGV